MCEELSKYLSSKFTMGKGCRNREFREGYVEMLDTLECLRVDKSPWLDGICPIILQKTRKEIAGAMAELFPSLLAMGEVYRDLRKNAKYTR